MRVKRILVAVFAFVIFAVGLSGNEKIASAVRTESIMVGDDGVYTVTPGDTVRIKIPLKAIGVSADYKDVNVIDENTKSPFTISKPKILTDHSKDISYISVAEFVYATFDVKVKETAKMGDYPMKLQITAWDYQAGYDENNNLSTYPLSVDFKLVVLAEKGPSQITISRVKCDNPMIGAYTNLNFAIKNEGEITARGLYYSINYGDSGIKGDYSSKKFKLGDLTPGTEKQVILPISILSTATEGKKTLTVNFEYKNLDGEAITDSYNIDVEIMKNDKAPNLIIESVEYEGDIKPGENIVVKPILKNVGGSIAKDIYLTVDASSLGKEGFIKNYFDDLWVTDIKADSKKKAEIPLTVSKGAVSGVKELVINIKYVDNKGLSYTKSETVYPDILGQGEGSSLLISNVSQSQASPSAGGRLDVSFQLENKGISDITDLKIMLDGLTGDTFIPVDSDPYIYIDKIEGGSKKGVKIPLILSDTIPEGMNNLTLKIKHSQDAEGTTVIVPVTGVVNDLGSNSKPKLIISKYTADTEELRAGSTFNLTFDLYNTNAAIAAKNITVTITQADTQTENVFSVTQGSNSFFINKIGPGETVQNTIELKVKADAKTAAYPIVLEIEYEYDGIKPNPETGEIGELKKEKLNLQVVENSRPVVDNVNVYSWDGNVSVGNPAMLSFEFYNMGRSPLNNVIATVEGDFTKSGGDMYFIGNVAEGTSAYVEFEVLPNIEGVAKGLVRITFEDSNGDKIEYTKDFETQVQSAIVFDPGMGDGGMMDAFNPMEQEVKKNILPLWLFIICQIAIAAVFIPITRKIVISAYKSKLLKEEQEQ
ncbi:hypothetical protein H0486_01145 [Lachnospiraceae bacterium MD1]|uniref:CARDB domain-containing protein n=1 Tax=Variimorphobacter saccharofermentans TaxID=2755051 RepID=A0A839JY01_9FIRM|nr:hypothetical protein [Variimorphobacter saccharofermentans]MBB2181499.1 hypothetical protein [Variimorphobacter saccharofermentans]